MFRPFQAWIPAGQEAQHRKQYEALKDKGMSKERAARIANSPDASKHGGERSRLGWRQEAGRTTALHKAAGRAGGKATARTHSSKKS